MPTNRAALFHRLAQSGPFGFGGSSLGNLYQPVPDDRARATVDTCWDEGVRLYDTAPFYGFGLSERRLGDALRERPRDSYLLSTKVGRLLVPGTSTDERFGFLSPMPFDPVFDYSYDGVMRSFEASLQRLGLARIDILYMHDLGKVTHGDDHDRTFAQAMDGGFRALADLREAGAIQAIGLGVNEVEICQASLAYADFDLFMIAGRHTLINQQAVSFLDACMVRGIGIVAAGIFNSGILATGVAGQDVPHYDYGPAPDKIVARVAAIERHCAAFAVPLAAAALQFARGHPAVLAAVIGSANPARIASATNLAQYIIPDAFWDALRKDGLIVGVPMPHARSLEVVEN